MQARVFGTLARHYVSCSRSIHWDLGCFALPPCSTRRLPQPTRHNQRHCAMAGSRIQCTASQPSRSVEAGGDAQGAATTVLQQLPATNIGGTAASGLHAARMPGRLLHSLRRWQLRPSKNNFAAAAVRGSRRAVTRKLRVTKRHDFLVGTQPLCAQLASALTARAYPHAPAKGKRHINAMPLSGTRVCFRGLLCLRRCIYAGTRARHSQAAAPLRRPLREIARRRRDAWPRRTRRLAAPVGASVCCAVRGHATGGAAPPCPSHRRPMTRRSSVRVATASCTFCAVCSPWTLRAADRPGRRCSSSSCSAPLAANLFGMSLTGGARGNGGGMSVVVPVPAGGSSFSAAANALHCGGNAAAARGLRWRLQCLSSRTAHLDWRIRSLSHRFSGH